MIKNFKVKILFKELKQICLFLISLVISSNAIIGQSRILNEQYIAKDGHYINYGNVKYTTKLTIYDYLETKKKPENYYSWFNVCKNCQYIIYNGDTINYYDVYGHKQNLHIDICFLQKENWMKCKGKIQNNACPDCDYIETHKYYRNDTITAFYFLGFKKESYDTVGTEIIINYIPYDLVNYDLIRKTKYILPNDGYIIEGIKNPKGYQGMVCKYDLETEKLIEVANYVNNDYCDSVVWYNLDETKKAEAFYNCNENENFHTFYRKSTEIKYAEVHMKNGRVVEKKCFDENGLNIIECDSTKTLTGELRLKSR